MFGILSFFIFKKLIYLQGPREKLLEQNAVGEGRCKRVWQRTPTTGKDATEAEMVFPENLVARHKSGL